MLKALNDWWKKHAAQECLESNSDCRGKVINAHTIQNQYALEHIEEDGHVYMMSDDFNRVSLKKIGRNKATTFTGYCSYHDNEVFKSIDFCRGKDLDNVTDQQLALLTLRAVAREYWAKLNVLKLYEIMAGYVRNSDLNGISTLLNVDIDDARIILRNSDDYILPYYTGVRQSSPHLKKHFNSLRTQIGKNKFHLSRFLVLRFPEPSNVLVSSFVSLEFDTFGNRIVDITLIDEIPGVTLPFFPAVARQ